MAIKIGKEIEVSVTSFKGELKSGLSIKELEQKLESLDASNPNEVAKEVDRCNDRCSDNDLDLDLKITDQSGEQETVHRIKFKGRISK